MSIHLTNKEPNLPTKRPKKRIVFDTGLSNLRINCNINNMHRPLLSILNQMVQNKCLWNYRLIKFQV